MTLFWPMLWLSGMLGAVLAFLVALMKESSQKKKALKSMQAKNEALAAQVESSPDFPEENLDFPTDSFPS